MVDQYEVIMINLNPVIGREKGHYRPIVIVSNELHNRIVKKVWAIPVTSRENRYPTDVDIETMNGEVYGVIDCSEIRSLDIIARDYIVKDKLKLSCIVEMNDIIKNIMAI